MTVVGDPICQGFPWPGSDNEEALSAVCFLAESSITVHCHPDNRFVFVDVFSCKDFDVDDVRCCIQRAFDMDRGRLLLLKRGVDPNTGDCVPAWVLASEE